MGDPKYCVECGARLNAIPTRSAWRVILACPCCPTVCFIDRDSLGMSADRHLWSDNSSYNANRIKELTPN